MTTLDDLEAAAATVYEHMAPTPQNTWPLLSKRSGAEVWVKHENHTAIGAFKVRGGIVYMDALKRRAPETAGVITATRGNHGQSIAWAAARFGLAATIVVPKGNNPEKNAAMRALGATLIEHGHDFQAAYEYTAGLAREQDLHMVPSFHSALWQGVASYSLEFLGAVPDLDTVYVPIGMGSGVCGMIAARDALDLKTRVAGVVEAGEPVSTNTADTIADGVACRVPSEEALAIILKGCDRVVSVSEDGILAAMGHYFTDTHNLAEGAGAAPLAALLKERDTMAGKRVGLVLSGGNVDSALFQKVLAGCQPGRGNREG
jgi:threonine dehydratase